MRSWVSWVYRISYTEDQQQKAAVLGRAFASIKEWNFRNSYTMNSKNHQTTIFSSLLKGLVKQSDKDSTKVISY